jgi:hypothetical protein
MPIFNGTPFNCNSLKEQHPEEIRDFVKEQLTFPQFLMNFRSYAIEAVATILSLATSAIARLHNWVYPRKMPRTTTSNMALKIDQWKI